MEPDQSHEFGMHSSITELRNEIDRIRSEFMALEISKTPPEKMKGVLARHEAELALVAKNRKHRDAFVPLEENKAHSLRMIRNNKARLENMKLL